MPRSCVVPGCSSNYKSTLSSAGCFSTFSFPKDEERRSKWIAAIHREKSFTITKSSAVCIKHFAECHIIRTDSMKRDDGSILEVPRQVPKLSSDAVPTIFPNQPFYMTVKVPLKRKHPDERRLDLEARDEAYFEDFCRKDVIINFEDFVSKFASKSLANFHYKVCDNFVLFYKLDLEGCPKITCSIKVFRDLNIEVYHNDSAIPQKKFSWLFGNNNSVISKWSMFESLISHCNSYVNQNSTLTCFDKIDLICKNLEQCASDLIYSHEGDYSVLIKKLTFLKEQLNLSITPRPRYSTNMFLWASSIFFQFPGSYFILRDSEVLTIPHPAYLRRAIGNVSSEVGIKDSQVEYLKKKCQSLEPHEKVVNILFDEIHITPKIEYKGGKLVGKTDKN